MDTGCKIAYSTPFPAYVMNVMNF